MPKYITPNWVGFERRGDENNSQRIHTNIVERKNFSREEGSVSNFMIGVTN